LVGLIDSRANVRITPRLNATNQTDARRRSLPHCRHLLDFMELILPQPELGAIGFHCRLHCHLIFKEKAMCPNLRRNASSE
jgi:hypothetical protein